ncbi:MAG: type II toxin-antitoxin system HipA family toxin [Trueperaceae bacterium]
MKDEVLVFIDHTGEPVRVGSLHREPRRGYEAVGFRYSDAWLGRPDAFSLEPALALGPGAFSPRSGHRLFGSLGDSAPDTWGRQLLRHAERRQANREGRPVRSLHELDFLLGVADVARIGALRFRRPKEEVFLAPNADGVPSVVHLQRLLEATDRTLRDEESEADLRLILAPGSSLGGARPKASMVDADGSLAIAKFPKETDEYSLERWEAIALALAALAGIRTARSRLVDVAGRPVLVVRRFDRLGEKRIPFLSALSMLARADGERASYPELVDALTRHGAAAKGDAVELYRRLAFNVLVSTVDDHLRNHAFLWVGSSGWMLSPAYDLNPTPVDVRERRLTTSISLEDATCEVGLVLEVAAYFDLSHGKAREVVREVALTTRTWRGVATSCGATPGEIERMASAFEHEDLEAALAL